MTRCPQQTNRRMREPLFQLLQIQCSLTSHYRQELLYRISMIHAAGVVLNHPTGILRTVGPHYDIKIIDFTEATIHVCHNVHRFFNSTPEEENEDEVDSESCLELTSIEKNISHMMCFISLYERALEEQNKCVAPRRSVSGPLGASQR